MSALFLAIALLGCAPRQAPTTQQAPAADVADPAASRPQTPKTPLPYPTRQLTWTAPDGTAMAGTLALPEGKGPHPAILLLTGSGAQDRDEALAGHRPFAVWADHLARRGIGTLRVDDRGVGGTGGSLRDATVEVLASDARAALDQLRAQEGVDGARVGLLGHSEGATIAGLVVADRDDLLGLVLLAGPGVPGRRVLITQGAALQRISGVPEAAVAEHTAAHEALLAAIGTGGEETAMWALVRTQIDIAVRYLGAPPPADLQPIVDGGMASISAPVFRSMLDVDPAVALGATRCPVLAVGGSLDLQVLPKENLDAIRGALDGNPDATVLEFRGLNHLFQHAGRGTPDEYGLLDETVAPEVLDAVTDWLIARAAPAGAAE